MRRVVSSKGAAGIAILEVLTRWSRVTATESKKPYTYCWLPSPWTQEKSRVTRHGLFQERNGLEARMDNLYFKIHWPDSLITLMFIIRISKNLLNYQRHTECGDMAKNLEQLDLNITKQQHFVDFFDYLGSGPLLKST